MTGHDRLNPESPKIEPAGRQPTFSSPIALQEPELWLPLRGGDPASDAALGRLAELEEQAEWLRERQQLVRVERLEQQAERLLRGLEDPAQLPTVTVRDHDDGYLVLPTPRRCDLANWHSDTPAPVADNVLTALLCDSQLRQVDKTWQLLASLHRHDRERADHIASGYLDPETTARTRRTRQSLQHILEQGLHDRLANHLHGPALIVYHYLTARGIHADGVRVCNECTTVFAGQRAARCPACTHAPVRISPRPWHQTIHPAARGAATRSTTKLINTHTGATLIGTINRHRGPLRTTYVGQCKACGDEYKARDARTRHCSDCASPAARVARTRAKRHAPPAVTPTA